MIEHSNGVAGNSGNKYTGESWKHKAMVDHVFADLRGAREVEVDRRDQRAVGGNEEVAVDRREHRDQELRRDAQGDAQRHQRAGGGGLAVQQHRGQEQPEGKGPGCGARLL